MASTDALLFIFCLIDGSSLLFLTVYFIITLSDLECDYINATTCCGRLNKWVLPELVAHTIIVVLQLFTWHPILFLMNALLAAWQIHKFVSKPSGSLGLYDPTEIHNRQQLKFYMRECMVKLGYHLVFFFIYLYSMILALVASD